MTCPVCGSASTATGKREEGDDEEHEEDDADDHKNIEDEADADRDEGTDKEEAFEVW